MRSGLRGGTAYLDYEYMGTSTVVSTDMTEPDIRKRIHRGNASTSSDPYADWDRFGRVTSEIWDGYKAGGSPDFIDMAVSYDRGHNITDLTDSVHTGWDVLYSINELNQVTGAEEGTLSGGSITSGTRDETWTYSQLGLWNLHGLDLNHDGDKLDANELDENNSLITGGYFNAANEWLKRDGTPDIDLTYDAAGNMTSNGTHDFTYDAMNRLVKVEASAATVNEYTYDALGRLIGFHYDTTRSGGGDPDGTVDANDPWFRQVFDGLQPIATYVGSDALANPKEHFYYEKAGFDGSGGSSYMMAQFRRDRDHSTAWYASSDGMERSDYYARLSNGSLGAVVTSAGNMVEWGKFSSYGVSMSSPTCDADGDFDVDINDINIMGGTYVVIEDVNLDGTLDTQDTLAALNIIGTTMGRGVLSYVGNRFGYAGYHHDLAVDEFRHLVFRMYDAAMGRHVQRDPIKYADGLSMYQYVTSNPIRYVDPLGLYGHDDHPFDPRWVPTPSDKGFTGWLSGSRHQWSPCRWHILADPSDYIPDWLNNLLERMGWDIPGDLLNPKFWAEVWTVNTFFGDCENFVPEWAVDSGWDGPTRISILAVSKREIRCNQRCKNLGLGRVCINDCIFAVKMEYDFSITLPIIGIILDAQGTLGTAYVVCRGEIICAEH